MMDLDEAIKHCEEVAEEQEKLYRLCPASDCDGTKDCITLKNGKGKGCQKCAEEHEQLAEWLKELKAYKEQSGDAVSKQAVLDAMYDLCDTGETLKENPWRDNPHIDAIIDAIDDLPSVTPQQRTGRWIDDEFGSKCSCCGIYTHLDKFDRPMKFKCCSMCGAKMEVEE